MEEDGREFVLVVLEPVEQLGEGRLVALVREIIDPEEVELDGGFSLEPL